MAYFNELTARLNILNSKKIFNQLKLINFKKSTKSNFSKFSLITETETTFDENKAPNKWYTQFYMGCILFSLVNSGMISNVLTGFEYNRDRQLKHDLSDIEHVKYELKAIDIWKQLTGYNVLDDNIRKEITNGLYQVKSFKDFVPIMQTLKKNEKHFFNNEIESIKKLCKSKDVSINSYDETEQKITYIRHLPYGSLVSHNEHWDMFLGIKDDNLILCNPLLSDKFETFNTNFVPFIDKIIIKEDNKC